MKAHGCRLKWSYRPDLHCRNTIQIQRDGADLNPYFEVLGLSEIWQGVNNGLNST